MKKLCIFLFLLGVLFARDNPFEPLLTPKDTTHNSQDRDSSTYFESFDFKLPTTARILKSVAITYENIDGSTDTKVLDINQSIDWHYPLNLSQINALVTEKTHYYSIPPFEFFTKQNKLYLHAPYAIQRSFVLPSPYRIVIDFDRQEPTIHQSISINKKYFTKITAGTHDKFYRIVLELDGQYQYQIQKDGNSYIISLE
ncbi:hypothetical protein BKH46_01755 [Helicobacter sp. 12S02634-8]|uniref:AMIN domain-containing protein n=1 Tax=Helicobacter sp. 12S02634-8 TaxID=1476199 RepID=UPI000BCB223E|nr:AMIN domain-containing protein [Helicobacter sp. 12S02634-8]PAF48060.1 hypothetical protein BKH46_01755 [Helicobacter sp. 12S02634-8]